ncbi:hypothetical protein T01_5350 [Trichinella spiralis]|uniref:Uncharacterized protein n=1 Tax=Trichinella spiralis TaxID=6334 RepID=A0A0V1AZC1_TRISP|nr:hypothetical protein T01_15016 [Trichinella spiralis]KRY30085.1 hypothetical protein T01_5350 [Trichinella spiralis]
MRSDQGHQENGKFHDSTFVSYFITNMRAVREKEKRLQLIFRLISLLFCYFQGILSSVAETQFNCRESP